jgi:WD40 repeat protein
LSVVHRPSSEHGSPERIVEVWSSRRGAELHLIAAHAAPITRLMFSADGSRLFSGTADEARAWSVADGTAAVGIARWDTSGSDGKVARSSDGKTRVEFADEALLIYRDGAYAPDVLRPDKGGPLFHRQPIASVRMLRDGRVVSLATARSDDDAAELVIWDIERAEALKKAFVHANIVAALVVAPDERTFVTTGAVGPVLAHAGTVHVWNTSELRLVASLTGHGSRVQAAAFSPDGKLLATGDIEGFVRLWDLSDTTHFVGEVAQEERSSSRSAP